MALWKLPAGFSQRFVYHDKAAHAPSPQQLNLLGDQLANPAASIEMLISKKVNVSLRLASSLFTNR
jgi:hypothetical protein